eukprot:CAMPEP_0172312388 /NCGR_PEP_ID=MMETSP1058-20130122/17329_1 /TAXON_ID=83371 /ORGANISM="Detonula confervacea, Strain CCMP 353" /LENGTH=641 /DNA_ID=CAMNT_0013025823 /DNA_START=228 /DNA_END=2153 /DNA_ORIENTATION=+
MTGNTNQQRGGILRSEVKKLDSFPSRAKELRSHQTKKGEDRHAWKKKHAQRKNRPIIVKKAIYHWRGITQKLRYAVQRNTIYVLECKDGKYYVGSTRNRKQRYQEHFESNGRRGSKWTRLHRPLSVIAEYKRIPSRYLMGMESQKTSELMVKYGVNNVRGAGYCLVREFTTDDLSGLTTFLGHYNQLDYDALGKELEKVLPKPRSPPVGVSFPPTRKIKSQNPNDTQLTGKDVAIMNTFNRKFRKSKTERRKKERKRSKEIRGKTKCFNCGELGHWASRCPNKGTSTENDASGSSTFSNRWESDAVATSDQGLLSTPDSDGSMDETESTPIEDSTIDPSLHPDSLPSSNTSSSAPAFTPPGNHPAADGERLSESYATTAKAKGIDEKLPTGKEVPSLDPSLHPDSLLPTNTSSPAPAFIPWGDLNTADNEEHLPEWEECSQTLKNSCSTRNITPNKFQRGKHWIMAILIHRYDRGIRDIDELNRDCIYYWDNNEKKNTSADITMEATPEGYIDLSEKLTPLPNEVDVFIRSMNRQGSNRNADSDSNDENSNPEKDPIFDFTIKGQEQAREALRNRKMALLAMEARQILLDRDIPLLKFAPGLGTEADVHALSKDEPAVFLSLFSRAFALYEQAFALYEQNK